MLTCSLHNIFQAKVEILGNARGGKWWNTILDKIQRCGMVRKIHLFHKYSVDSSAFTLLNRESSWMVSDTRSQCWWMYPGKLLATSLPVVIAINNMENPMLLWFTSALYTP
jgi:hypothetical protein